MNGIAGVGGFRLNAASPNDTNPMITIGGGQADALRATQRN
jgi:hypothetical protein